MAFEEHIDVVTLAREVDRFAPRLVSLQGGCPPFPKETMARILFLKRCYNNLGWTDGISITDRMNYKRFFRLTNSASIPDRTTVQTFENRISEVDA